jgi:tetratricopeptide (TPR) repeat protein
MINIMKVRCVKSAFVSAVFLAAFATISGAAFASPSVYSDAAHAGFKALQSGDPKTAITQFTTAIESRELAPELLANALLNRALAHQLLKQDSLAIDDYTSALSLDAMSPELRATALHNRGLSRQKQGDLPIAIQDFTSALMLNPQFSQAFYSRGNALRESGQLLFALSDFDRALRFQHPDEARVHFGLAMTYLSLKRPLDAKKELSMVLKANPEHAQAREELEKLNTQAGVDKLPDPLLVAPVKQADAQGLPPAVDVPSTFDPSEEIAAEDRSVTEKIVARLPETEVEQDVAAVVTSPEPAKITLDEVPEIPEASAEVTASLSPAPEIKPKKTVDVATAEVEKIEDPETTQQIISQGWVVQISSAVSEDAAWSTWGKLQKKHKVLSGVKPVVIKADLGSKGTFYRLRLNGFEAQDGAKKACAKLKKGGVDCYVSKS